MADRLEPTGFWSYTTSDDRSTYGHLTKLRIRLAASLQLKVGRTAVRIFQDKHAIPIGVEWEKEIYRALDASSFFLPIVTPGFLQSEWCCREVLYFREREKNLNRSDLIFPFIYSDTAHIDPDNKDDCWDKAVLQLLRSRQHFDFQDLIHDDVDVRDVRQRIGVLAAAIDAALRRRASGASARTPEPKTIVSSSKPPPTGGAAPKHPEIIRDIPNGPELVLVPNGSFIMGVPPEEAQREGVPKEYQRWCLPQLPVTIGQPFWLGRYPVTRGQFAAFVAARKPEIPDHAWTFEPDDKGEWKYESRNNRGWRNPGFPQTDNDPVVCVSHEDAMAYVSWLREITGKDYRLPSEAEWEYAARAGTTTACFWGDGRAEAVRHAKVADRALMARTNLSFDPDRFFDGDSGYPFTAPVGCFLPNPFGLYDMLGNVWEWTADCWNEDLKGMPADGSARTTGDCSRRVVRGGSWDDNPWVVRAGGRGWNGTGDRDSGTGFRVARTYFDP